MATNRDLEEALEAEVAALNERARQAEAILRAQRAHSTLVGNEPRTDEEREQLEFLIRMSRLSTPGHPDQRAALRRLRERAGDDQAPDPSAPPMPSGVTQQQGRIDANELDPFDPVHSSAAPSAIAPPIVIPDLLGADPQQALRSTSVPSAAFRTPDVAPSPGFLSLPSGPSSSGGGKVGQDKTALADVLSAQAALALAQSRALRVGVSVDLLGLETAPVATDSKVATPERPVATEKAGGDAFADLQSVFPSQQAPPIVGSDLLGARVEGPPGLGLNDSAVSPTTALLTLQETKLNFAPLPEVADYRKWRFTSKATILEAARGLPVAVVEQLLDEIVKLDAPSLAKNSTPALERLDVAIYGALLRANNASKTDQTNALGAKLEAAPYGRGRIALQVVDHHYGHETQKLVNAAAREIQELAKKVTAMKDVDLFLSTFRRH